LRTKSAQTAGGFGSYCCFNRDCRYFHACVGNQAGHVHRGSTALSSSSLLYSAPELPSKPPGKSILRSGHLVMVSQFGQACLTSPANRTFSSTSVDGFPVIRTCILLRLFRAMRPEVLHDNFQVFHAFKVQNKLFRRTVRSEYACEFAGNVLVLGSAEASRYNTIEFVSACIIFIFVGIPRDHAPEALRLTRRRRF